MYFVFILFAVILSVLNIFVRREAPPVAASKPFKELLTSAPRVFCFYAALLVFTWLVGRHN
jgi:hypothetical protein